MAYNPAGNTTSTGTLSHLATVYYDRTGLDVLRTKFMYRKVTDPRLLPRKNGKTIQFYRYGTFGANTTAKTEGQVGTSLQLTTTTVSATVSQYADFISFSDLLEATAIDPVVENGVVELSYRAGLTVDNLVRAEIDTAAVSIDESALGTYFSSKDCAHIAHELQGLNVRPLRDNYFTCLAHPYVTYDLVNDPQAGGFQDLVKHDSSSQGNGRLFSREDRGFVARVHGVEVWETTNTTQVSGSPNKWRAYFVGAGALAAIPLAGQEPSNVMDPASERFSINVIRPGRSAADPEGVISAYASYKFTFVTKIMDSTTYRMRKIDFPSSIVA